MTSTTVAPTATTWKIDPSHSHVEFAVRHLMISTVKGRFAGVSGSVQTPAEGLAGATADVTIDPASIDTREPRRDAHLKSPDFFDVEKFPSLTFRSTRISDVDGTDFQLTGDLTLHGVTKPVTLTVSEEGRGGDPWGGQRAGFTAAGKIKRSDFGLTWNQALETGGFVVGDEVKISLDIQLVKVNG